jgi:hypothetical protein
LLHLPNNDSAEQHFENKICNQKDSVPFSLLTIIMKIVKQFNQEVEVIFYLLRTSCEAQSYMSLANNLGGRVGVKEFFFFFLWGEQSEFF